MGTSLSKLSLLMLVVASPLFAEGIHYREYFFGKRPTTQDLLFSDRVARENGIVLGSADSPPLNFHQVGSTMGTSSATDYNGISKLVVPAWRYFAAGKRVFPGNPVNPYCKAFLHIPSPTGPRPVTPADSNDSFEVANTIPFPSGSQSARIEQNFRYLSDTRTYSNHLEVGFSLPEGTRGYIWCWKTSPSVNPWTLGELRAVFGDRPGELGGILRFQLGGQ